MTQNNAPLLGYDGEFLTHVEKYELPTSAPSEKQGYQWLVLIIRFVGITLALGIIDSMFIRSDRHTLSIISVSSVLLWVFIFPSASDWRFNKSNRTGLGNKKKQSKLELPGHTAAPNSLTGPSFYIDSRHAAFVRKEASTLIANYEEGEISVSGGITPFLTLIVVIVLLYLLLLSLITSIQLSMYGISAQATYVGCEVHTGDRGTTAYALTYQFLSLSPVNYKSVYIGSVFTDKADCDSRPMGTILTIHYLWDDPNVSSLDPIGTLSHDFLLIIAICWICLFCITFLMSYIKRLIRTQLRFRKLRRKGQLLWGETLSSFVESTGRYPWIITIRYAFITPEHQQIIDSVSHKHTRFYAKKDVSPGSLLYVLYADDKCYKVL